MNPEQNNWTKFLKFYTEANAGRPTRLGVFEKNGDYTTDYWLEDGLPFVGIDADRDDGVRSVQIFAGQMTHSVPRAEKITFHLALSQMEDGFDVIDADGTLTMLRFENQSDLT